MHRLRNSDAFDRRRLLTGAGALLAPLPRLGAHAQEAQTPEPIRIQTPDLAFTNALQRQLADFQNTTGNNDLLLSIVPAEPASDSLMSDLRLNGRRFAGAFVPQWLIPDLVRDGLITPAGQPPAPLPPVVAQLRSFGGEWVSTDLDHDCDLLYVRLDLLDDARASIPESWDELHDMLVSTDLRIALPQNHAEQVVDHWAAMSASFTSEEPFWFMSETMEPTIASVAHQQSLDVWKSLGAFAIESSSTGDLWSAFAAGEVVTLIGSADAFPFFLESTVDPAMIGVAQLPGMRMEDGRIHRAGNTAGANWGGVTIAGLPGTDSVKNFLGHLASPVAQAALWTDRTTGVNPAVLHVGESLVLATAATWPQSPTERWLTAIEQTLNNPLQLPPLRIAETQRYLQALELRIVAYLTGTVGSSREALELAAADWRDITHAIDIDVQRDLFQRSLMPPPVV